MIMPQIFDSADDFNQWFDFQQAGNQQVESVQQLHKILRPFLLRRTKKELATKLPDKVEININIVMTNLQMDLYIQMLENQGLNLADNNNKMIKTQYKNILMQLRKVCNHPYLFDGIEDKSQDEYGEHLITASGKLVFLDKLLAKIQNQKDQVLIFS